MFLKSLTAGLALAIALAGAANAGTECLTTDDAKAGQAVTKLCVACHEFNDAKPSKPTGPNLHGVFGEKMMHRSDYPRYSAGIKAAAEKGGAWTEEALMEYLADPKAYLNKVSTQNLANGMAFNLKDEAKRKQAIAYLKAIKGNAGCF